MQTTTICLAEIVITNEKLFSVYTSVGLSLEPLIGAIAAGNAVVIKPSELAPASASVLASALHSYLDNKAVKVIQGGPSVGGQLLQQKWDKIFFTGLSNYCSSFFVFFAYSWKGWS